MNKVKGYTQQGLAEKIMELMIIVPKGTTLRQAYTDYLINKLRKTNMNIFRFQFMTRNCNVQLHKRFELEKELGITSKRLYQHVEERMEEDNGVEYRDVFVAFTPFKGDAVKKKDWRKFLTPDDVIGYKYTK